MKDRNCHYIDQHHATLEEVMDKATEPLLGYDCVCTVRNPLDFVVSRWRLGKGHRLPFAEWVKKNPDQLHSKWSGLWKACNIVCWFENLQNDLNHVFDRRVPLEHNHLHRTNNKQAWGSYYDKETFEIVVNHFADYVSTFGYENTFIGDGVIATSISKAARKNRLRKIGYGRHQPER